MTGTEMGLITVMELFRFISAFERPGITLGSHAPLGHAHLLNESRDRNT
jgi:hypothetical protein